MNELKLKQDSQGVFLVIEKFCNCHKRGVAECSIHRFIEKLQSENATMKTRIKSLECELEILRKEGGEVWKK